MYVSSGGVIFESLRRRYLDRIPFFLLTVCPHTRKPDYSTYYHIQSRTRACTRCSNAPYPFTGRLMFHKDDVRSLSLLHRRAVHVVNVRRLNNGAIYMMRARRFYFYVIYGDAYVFFKVRHKRCCFIWAYNVVVGRENNTTSQAGDITPRIIHYSFWNVRSLLITVWGVLRGILMWVCVVCLQLYY